MAAAALADTQHIRELASSDPGLLQGEIHWSRDGLDSLAVKHRHFDVVRLLLDLGADVDERTVLHQLDEPTPSWASPLWFAAPAGRYDIAELLLDRGADPNANVCLPLAAPQRLPTQRRSAQSERLPSEFYARPAPLGSIRHKSLLAEQLQAQRRMPPDKSPFRPNRA